MSELVERLRTYRPTNEWGDPVHHTICDEAADRIEALEAENARLQATGQFLIDRIDQLEWMDDGYNDLVRDWMGHVDPALARFRAALKDSSHG